MEKSLYIEPTGNEFSLKCKLESKVSDENTILWFQLVDDGKSTDDITLEKLNRNLNGSKEMTLAAFETFQKSFGDRLYPQSGEERKTTRLKNSKQDDLISFSKNGQKIKFQPIQESLNGFYTCMYAETCSNSSTKVVIGKTFEVKYQMFSCDRYFDFYLITKRFRLMAWISHNLYQRFMETIMRY